MNQHSEWESHAGDDGYPGVTMGEIIGAMEGVPASFLLPDKTLTNAA